MNVSSNACPADPPPEPIQSDEECVALWLSNTAPHTREAYQRDYAKFRDVVGLPLRSVTVREILAFQAALTGALSSRVRTMSALRSLFRFATSVGYLCFNPMSVLRSLKARPNLGGKYLSPGEVQRLFSQADGRNRLLLQTLYYGGLRVSELCGLRWQDVVPRLELGSVQLCVTGKGGIPRQVPVPSSLGNALLATRHRAPLDAPVFRSRQGGALDRSQVLRIVKACARKAGLPAGISPHWLRHAHATHAIERGVPLHVIQQTLGHSSLSVTGLYLHACPSDASGMHLGQD